MERLQQPKRLHRGPGRQKAGRGWLAPNDKKSLLQIRVTNRRQGACPGAKGCSKRELQPGGAAGVGLANEPAATLLAAFAAREATKKAPAPRRPAAGAGAALRALRPRDQPRVMHSAALGRALRLTTRGWRSGRRGVENVQWAAPLPRTAFRSRPTHWRRALQCTCTSYHPPPPARGAAHG